MFDEIPESSAAMKRAARSDFFEATGYGLVQQAGDQRLIR
jgi:hypothetical protein